MSVKGELVPDLYAIHFSGTDAFGQKFEIALLPEDAKNLIYRLHRVVMIQAQMRLAVQNAKDGGKGAA